MKRKHLAAFLLVMLMTIGMIPSFVFAKEITLSYNGQKDEEITEEIPPQTVKQDKPSDNEGLFNKYIEKRLEDEKNKGKPFVRKRSIPSGNSLTGYNKLVYDALKKQIAEVAAGTRTSTVFEVSYSEIGLAGVKWTAADLGVTSIKDSNGKTTDEAIDAIIAKIGLDLHKLNETLLADCPYELYWYDKTIGVSSPGTPFSSTSQYVTFSSSQSITYKFYVAAGYATGPLYTVKYSDGSEAQSYLAIDTTKIERVNNAIANAHNVVKAAKNKTDYDKLAYYRNWICEQVSYDYPAANGGAPYGDPWQLISAFDGDTSTKIVCEGYSKAFMYLCELTSFDTSIQCITATGVTNGPHMWNIVKMEDGKYYLVDVTNYDAGCTALFLAGYISGNKTDGYSFKKTSSGGTLTYKYDSDTLGLYDEELLISSSNYDPNTLVGTCGSSLNWTFSGGVLKITGTGKMTDWMGSSVCPWNSRKTDIKKIIISDGVTSIGINAFTDCTNLTEVSIPDSITLIGTSAFENCRNISTVNFGGSKLEWKKINIGTGNGDLTNLVIKFAFLSVSLDDYSGGTVGLSKTRGVSGDLITITAVPDAGYDLVSIELNGSLLTGTTQFALEGLDVKVKVTFAKHELAKTDKKAATCTEDGCEEYYTCSRCHKLFSDPEGKNEISAPVVINKLGHDLEEFPEQAPTKTADGHITYYKCKREGCGKIFKDAKGTEEITLEQTRIPKLTHILTHVPAQPATCTEDGTIEYYECRDTECGCGNRYSDKYGQNKITSIVDPAKGHDTEEVTGKAATCTSAGFETYFKCKRCKKLFSDKDGKNEISEPVVIPALGHDKEHLEHHEYKAPTRDNDGNKEYWVCTVCGTYFLDADCTEEVEPVKVIIQKIGAAGLDEEFNDAGLKYKVTNPSTTGSGTVVFMGMENPVDAVSIPATVVYKETTYKVTRIGTKAFYGDKTIKSVYIGANVVTIDSYAFYGCSNLVSVTGGYRLKSIGTKAFGLCSKLKTFKITSTVLSKIGSYAFYKDKKLKTIYIKNTTKLTKSGVKKSLKSSKVKTVKVKRSKIRKYRSYFRKKNSGRYVRVKK